MKLELKKLLEIYGYEIFDKFLPTFGFAYWQVSESPEYEGIRAQLRYKEKDCGERIMITTSNGDEYIFHKCAIGKITSDFKRFINLRAFL